MGCTLAPPGEYNWTVHVWRRCGLFVRLLWPLVVVVVIVHCHVHSRAIWQNHL